MVAKRMFLHAKIRKKNRKLHRFFSVVENRRWARPTAQRTVLYLREINDSHEAIWRKTLQVFDDSQQQYTSLSLFPEDREIPAEASNSIQVKLSENGVLSAARLRQLLVLAGRSQRSEFLVPVFA